MVRRIYAYTECEFTLTIVDNGSDPETKALLRRIARGSSNATVLLNARNRQCGGGTLQALRLMEAPYAVYMCSYECFVFEEGWDRKCLEFMEVHPQVALAGHLVSSPAYATGAGYEKLESFPLFRNPQYARERQDDLFFHVQGGFYVLRTEAMRQTGSFNPDIPHDHMDVEYSYFLESEGWQIADLAFVNSIHWRTRPKLEGYVPAQSIYHPLTLEDVSDYERQRDAAGRAGRECNLCGWRGQLFRTMVAPRYDRRDASCPGCGSFERHRALIAYVDSWQDLRGKTVLDIAPVPGFARYFEERGAHYVSMDFNNPAAVRADLRRLPLGDESVDLVICYHVLEHVVDDVACSAEITRVLRPGGRALVQVPQNRFRWKTIEFEAPDQSNHGHVRDPGLDYGGRLGAPGVEVLEEDLALRFPLEDRIRFGFYKDTGLTYELRQTG